MWPEADADLMPGKITYNSCHFGFEPDGMC